LILVGLNHRSAPVEVRERCTVAASACPVLDEKLVRLPAIDEAAIVSTCNRTELLAVSADADGALDQLARFLANDIGDGAASAEHIYELRDGDAVLHLFRVASSLDSMVVGEAQILGQMKQAYRAGVEARSCGPILNRLFHRAFRAAKRVRSRTGLGASTVSVARVGVQLAREIFEDFTGKQALLVGAGEMAESALHGFREAGVGSLVIVNRSLEPARRLAEKLSGRAASLDQLESELRDSDLALVSVASDGPILVASDLERVTSGRHGRPLLLIDLGLPRNVDPDANRIDNVYLYDLDDLERVAERGRAERHQSIAPAEKLVARERDAFESWRASLGVVPTIRDLLAHGEEVAKRELQRTLRRLEGPGAETEAAVERMAQAIVAKLLHLPLEQLRSSARGGAGLYYAEATRRLFGLDEDELDAGEADPGNQENE
jgi:glutamyl-tRNA reductase